MIDRTAPMRGITGSADMLPASRRSSKMQARKRSRSAARNEVLEQLDCPSDKFSVSDDSSTWTVLSPGSGKFHNTVWVIEGNEDLAVRVYAAFNGGRHPGKTSCDCGCGPDYYIDERIGTLEVATAIERNCCITIRKDGSEQIKNFSVSTGYNYQSLEQFLLRKDVVVIRGSEIKAHELEQALPTVSYPSMYSQEEQTLAWLLDIEL